MRKPDPFRALELISLMAYSKYFLFDRCNGFVLQTEFSPKTVCQKDTNNLVDHTKLELDC